MYAHKVPKYYLKKWSNGEGKESVFFFDKEQSSFVGSKNTSNVFGEGNYYYLNIILQNKNKTISDMNLSGSQMFMTDALYKPFKSFFDDLDSKVFNDCRFYQGSEEVLANKSYNLIYNFYSIVDKQIRVVGRNGREIKRKTLQTIIENAWFSEEYRKTNEQHLSKIESKSRPVHDSLLAALNNNNVNDLLLIHNDVAVIMASQQSRQPDDIIVRHSIDEVIKIVNKVVNDNNCPELTIRYDDEDYRNICQVQLMKSIYPQMNDVTSGYDSTYDTLLSLNKQALYFYARAYGGHKFVIGDNPIVSIKKNDRNMCLAMPISPDYCLIVVRTSQKAHDYIINVSNRVVDYINWLEFENSKTGIVSCNLDFVSKQRTLDFSLIEKKINKKGFFFL